MHFFEAKLSSIMVKTRKGLETADSAGHFDSKVDQFQANVIASLADLKKQILDDSKDAESSSKTDAGSLIGKLILFEENVKNAVSSLKNEIVNLRKQEERLEQELSQHKRQTLRNAVVINGVPENESESPVSQALKILCNKVKINVSQQHINYAYRMGKKDNNRKNPRPLAVVFVNRWMRDELFKSKKALKGSTVVMCEMLSREKLQLYKKVRAKVGVRECWTWSGNIYVGAGGQRRIINSDADLERL